MEIGRGEFGKWKDEMEIGRMALVGHRIKQLLFFFSPFYNKPEICAFPERRYSS